MPFMSNLRCCKRPHQGAGLVGWLGVSRPDALGGNVVPTAGSPCPFAAATAAAPPAAAAVAPLMRVSARLRQQLFVACPSQVSQVSPLTPGSLLAFAIALCRAGDRANPWQRVTFAEA